MIDAAVEKRIYSPPPVKIKPPIPQPNPPGNNVHGHHPGHGHGQYHGRLGQPANSHPHFPDEHRSISQGRFPGDPGHFPEHTRGNGPMSTEYHPPNTMGRGEPVYHGRNRHPSHENVPHPYDGPYRPGKPAMHPRDNFPPPPDVGASYDSYHSHGRDHSYHHSGHPVQQRFPDSNPRDRYGQRYPPGHGHFPDDPYGHRGPPNRGPPPGPPGPPGRFPPSSSRDSDNRFRPY